jgi:hypothetical protein
MCIITLKLLSKRGCDLIPLVFTGLLFFFDVIGFSYSIAVLVGIAFKRFDFIFNLFVKK